MSSLDPIISADLVRTRAELAAVTTALANARNEIAGVAYVMNVTRNELAAARNEIAGVNVAVGGNSVIKSVQRGVAVIPPVDNPGQGSLTVAVAAVNLDKCMLNITGMAGQQNSGSSVVVPVPGYARLTSSTTIQLTLTRNIMYGSSPPFYMCWEIVEFK
ncbi:hypothetical protein [Delftia tsuruhatensis]|uniref:hypothetical protein n=1 Tax=Delftia tsuruhatensis TaxID=180282 RepID=UPI002091D181|nr:hypothetical protein [Delftia tsuruhatensis]MCO5339246.1 hypothetical protein [Delftia tsuruhatensis]MCR4546861.1 hypothetical protein [Delftia tsuruhatensis]